MRNKIHSENQAVSVNSCRVGRKKRWAEDMVARFEAGTFWRIAEVLEDGEDRTDFVRAAVAREVSRRERRRARQAKPEG